MKFNFLIQEIPTIPNLPGNNGIYVWIVSILVLVVVAIVIYFKGEVKNVRDELALERAYIKDQSVKNMLTLSELSNILKGVMDTTEKSLDNTSTMKPLMESNSDRIEVIKDHVLRIKREENGR